MTDELRIRLEGSWEVVEAATALYERAAKSLAEGQTEAVAQALSLADSGTTQNALNDVTRLASGSVELQELLERHSQARASFSRQLTARMAGLGLEASPGQGVVLFEGRGIQLYAWGVAAGVAAGVSLFTRDGPNEWLILFSFAFMFWAAASEPRKLRVTNLSVTVGDRVFIRSQLRAVRSTHVQLPFRKRSAQWFLDFERHDGSVEQVEISHLPRGFLDAMNRIALPVNGT
ncbi:MAG: hypothetical protein ACO1OB_32495 [Archangium sp.]